jgi:hypothetical protein
MMKRFSSEVAALSIGKMDHAARFVSTYAYLAGLGPFG